MINIAVAKPYKKLVDQEQVQIAAQTVLNILRPEMDYELTILVEDDSHVQKLNKQYRQIDQTTDVLSFESNDLNPESGLLYLGDIIISYPMAYNQSIAAGHPVLSELQLLVVHGLLHLLGYDHAEPVEKEKMWAVQKDILDQLGVIIDHYPDD
jgi:probable rRNA maturation factor